MTRFSPAVDANTTEIAELTWELPSDVQVHPGETFFYSGCCVHFEPIRFGTSGVMSPRIEVETEFSWKDVTCSAR